MTMQQQVPVGDVLHDYKKMHIHYYHVNYQNVRGIGNVKFICLLETVSDLGKVFFIDLFSKDLYDLLLRCIQLHD
jgi:AAA15 family ATPase/GTPase